MKVFLQLLSKFQSLIGFKINWNLNQATVSFLGNLFQSLIGFKINWNSLMIVIPESR